MLNDELLLAFHLFFTRSSVQNGKFYFNMTGPLQLIPTISLTTKFMKSQINSEIERKGRKKSTSKSSDESQCDDSYVPRFMNSRRKRFQIKQTDVDGEKGHNFNNSLWNLQENVAYMNFLHENGHHFESNWHQRKSLKINVLLSNSIKTRSPAQCRSHHQKMMKYHDSIPSIIDHIFELQKAASALFVTQQAPKEEFKNMQTQTADVILQDLSEKWGWVDEYEDLWNRMMDQRWLQGTDEFDTIK